MTQKLESSMGISLLRLARVALWLGIAGFGGGFAIVQQLRRIVVQRYQWVTEEAFLDFFRRSQCAAWDAEHEPPHNHRGSAEGHGGRHPIRNTISAT